MAFESSTGKEAEAFKHESKSMNLSDKEGQWSVEKTVASIPGPKPQANTESPVPFFHIIERLKTTAREGWRRHGIASAESISDHMYRMSIITMFAPASLSSRMNIPHCMKMALVHDMAEALVGDITPVDGVSKAEKSRRESTTMDYLTNSLLGSVNGGLTGKEINEIWQEYEDSQTLESQFVHDVDKFELILQMFEYERLGNDGLAEFASVAEKILLPEVRKWSDEVLQEREVFWKDHGGLPEIKDKGKKKQIETNHDNYYGENRGCL